MKRTGWAVFNRNTRRRLNRFARQHAWVGWTAVVVRTVIEVVKLV